MELKLVEDSLEDIAEAVEAAPLQTIEQVVENYMPLVRHAVNRIAFGRLNSTYLDYQDLVSCGVQGLIEAFHSFDSSRGAKFSTFALPRIRGAVLDALRAAHPLPRSLQRTTSRLEKAQADLYARLSRTPTPQEVADHAGLPVAKAQEAAQASAMRVMSLERLAEFARGGATESLAELADADPHVDPEAAADESVLRSSLMAAVQGLPERERTVVSLYYIGSESLKAIGDKLRISESRVSQPRERAVGRLRDALAREELVQAA